MLKNQKKNWPLIIIRQMDYAHYYIDKMYEIIDTFKKYPDACDEIWFATSSMNKLDDIKKQAEKINHFFSCCQQNNIKFSIQQGITLGHVESGALEFSDLATSIDKMEDFSDEAWLCDTNGTILKGLLCPSSEEVQRYLFEYAKIVIETLKPESYWMDDDTRLCYKTRGCFCPRCIKLFSEKIGYKIERNELVDALFSTKKGENIRFLRANWIEFHSESLAAYLGNLRKAAEFLDSSCRLGLQAVNSTDIYDGLDFSTQLKALSRETPNSLVGIRPGGGYYSDEKPIDVNLKLFDIAREAARCRKYNFIGQICYEAENYPHIAILKSPDSMMKECALMMFAGANSLALYYHSQENSEPVEYYEEFAKQCSSKRSLFEKLSSLSDDTFLYGISRYEGENFLDRELSCDDKDIYSVRDCAVLSLLGCGLPIVPEECVSQVKLVTLRSVREMSINDFPKLKQMFTIMDVETAKAIEALGQLKQFGVSLNHCKDNLLESFGDFTAQGVAYELEVNTQNVTTLSRLKNKLNVDIETANEHGIGSCVIDFVEGGKMAIVQKLSKTPTYYRRENWQKALDVLSNNTFLAHLKNSIYSDFLLRVNSAGQLVSVLIYNLGVGQSSNIKLLLRNPLSKHFTLQLWSGEQKAMTLEQKIDEHTWYLELPPLNAYDIMILFFDELN